MKSLLTIWAVTILCITSFTACNKRDTPSAFQSTTSGSRPSTYTNSTLRPEPPNYCKNCGESSDPLFGCIYKSCVQVEDDPDDQPCPLKQVEEHSENQAALNDSAYAVRDSFLINFEKGQWYITYYYELGAVAKSNHLITSSNYSEYLSFAKEVLALANEIQNGNPASIPVTTQFKAKAQAFINTFKAHTADATVLGYLNDIENDVNQFSGKNNAFIRSAIGL